MNRHIQSGPEKAHESGGQQSPASPELDMSEYADDMVDFDMTEDQKREFLETLWSIMRAFAEMGIQYDVCGQLFGDFNDAAGSNAHGVNLDHSTNTEKQLDQSGKESSP